MAVSPRSGAYPQVQPGHRVETTSYELRVTHPLRSRSSSSEGPYRRSLSTDIRVRRSPSADARQRPRDALQRGTSVMSLVSIKDETIAGGPSPDRGRPKEVARDAFGKPTDQWARERGKPFAWQSRPPSPSRPPGPDVKFRPPQRAESGTYLGPTGPSGTSPQKDLGTFPFPLQQTPSGRMLGPVSPSKQFLWRQPPQTGYQPMPVSPSQYAVPPAAYQTQLARRTPSGTLLGAGVPSQQYVGPDVRYQPSPVQRTPSGTVLGRVSPSGQYPGQWYAPFPVRRTSSGTVLGGVSPRFPYPGQVYQPLPGRRTPSGTMLRPMVPSRQYVAPTYPLRRSPSGVILAPISPSQQRVIPGFVGSPLRRSPSGVILAPISPSQQRVIPGFVGSPLRRTPSGVILAPLSPSQQPLLPRFPERTRSGMLTAPVSPSRQYLPPGYQPSPFRRAPSAAMLAPVTPGARYTGPMYQTAQLPRTSSGTLLVPITPSRQYLLPIRQPPPFRRTPSPTMLTAMPSRTQYSPGRQYQPVPVRRTPSPRFVGPAPPPALFLGPLYKPLPPQRTPSGTLLPTASPSRQYIGPGYQPLPVRRTQSGTLLAPVSPSRDYFGQGYQPSPLRRMPSATLVSQSPWQTGPVYQRRTPSGTVLATMSPSRQYLPQMYAAQPMRPAVSASMIGRMSPSQTTLLSRTASQPAISGRVPSVSWYGGSPSRMSLTASPSRSPVVIRAPSWYMSQPRGGTPVGWSPSRTYFVSPFRSPAMTSPMVLKYLRKYRRDRHVLLEWIVVWVFIVTMAVLLLAILVVFDFQKTRLDEHDDHRLRVLTKLSSPKAKVMDDIEGHLVRWPNAKMLRGYLKELTKYTKLAGVQRNRSIAHYLLQMWKKHGLTDSKLDTYSVVLTLPDEQKPNTVELLTGPAQNRWTSLSSQEKEIPGVTSAFTPPFNAYSYSGSTTGTVMYCNHCLPQDFDRLATMKIDTDRKICLCRYSPHVSPGTAMAYAERNHVAGVLFFLDPADVAPHTGTPFFPNSWWMPPTAIRRANMRGDSEVGDLTTPGYSSRGFVKNLYRRPLNDAHLPKVLSQPITSTSAQTIFKFMKGLPCPHGWAPQLQVKCNLGDKSQTQVRMTINNQMQLAQIENAMAHIQGSVEPDRYVILGVPIDAWSTGAVAPGTAIAQILEVSRVIGHLVMRKNWKPRRTIVFAGWDGRQFGHLGSTEYIEGKRQLMMSRAAIYVNTDMCTSGGEFLVSASPSVMDSFESAAQVVPYLQNEKQAYYSAWMADQKTKRSAKGVPQLPPLRSQGSHLPVVQHSGVPSLDVSFGNNFTHGLHYPAMGTGYDTFELVDNFIDPGFRVQQMCTQLIAVVMRRWADAAILPYNFERLRNAISAGVADLERKHSNTLRKYKISIGTIKSAVGRLAGSLDALTNYIATFQIINPIETRQLNDRIMYMERIFVQDVLGSTGIVRNMLFGWSTTNKGRMVFFPTLDDMLARQALENAADLQPIHVHVSRVASALHQAADFVDVYHIL